MNGPERPRAVVFDLDGTLLDSHAHVLAAITHAVEPFGSPPTRDIFIRLGGPPERFLLPMLERPDNLPAALERLEWFHRTHAHRIRPYDGVPEFLAQVQTTGIRTAIWTGRDRRSTERLLRDHRIESRFATIVCGDDLPTHKPDPAGLREILRRLGVGTGQALFVGDADVDVLGGDGCGVATLLIDHARTVDPSIASRAWRTVRSPREAFDVVLRRVQMPDEA